MNYVDKLKYLRSYLEEPARSVIAGFTLTDADYKSAIEIWKKRFAKPSVIKRAHINELLKLPPIYSERNVSKLYRNLFPTQSSFFSNISPPQMRTRPSGSATAPTLSENLIKLVLIQIASSLSI